MKKYVSIVTLAVFILISQGISQSLNNDNWQEKLVQLEESGDMLTTLEFLEELDQLGVDSTGDVSAKLDVYSSLLDELLFEDLAESTDNENQIAMDSSAEEFSSFDHLFSTHLSYDNDQAKYSSRLLGLELGYSLGYSFEMNQNFHMLGASIMGEFLRGRTKAEDSEPSDTRQISTSYSLSYVLLSGNWTWMSLLDYSKWDDKADTDTTQVKALLLYQSISQDFITRDKWKGTWNVFGSYSPDFDNELGLGLSTQYKSAGLRWKIGAQVKRTFSDRVSYEILEEIQNNNNLDTVSMISNIEEWLILTPYIDWRYKLGESHVMRAKLSMDIEDLLAKDEYLKYLDGDLVWDGSIIDSQGDAHYSSNTGEEAVYSTDGHVYQKSVRVVDWYLRLGYDYLLGKSGDLGSLEFSFKYEGQSPVFESKSNPKEDQTRFYGSLGYSIEF